MKVQGMKRLLQFWKDIEDEYSYNNIIDLRKQSYIPFIGSGMSVPFGYTDWSGFLSSVINEYYDQGEKTHAEFDKLLAQGEYLTLAEKINIKLNYGIAEEVRKAFHINKIIPLPSENNYLRLLWNAGIKTLVTTNFDSVIEKNTGISADSIYLPSNLINSGDAIEAIRTGKGGLIKLHGTWNKAESVILTETDFNRAYCKENTALTTTVDYLWNSSVLLFLGCGLKKDYLVDRMSHLAGKGKQNWHYAVLAYPKVGAKQVKLDLMQLKIRPIWFEEKKFDQIQVILKMITSVNDPEPDDDVEEDNAHSSTQRPNSTAAKRQIEDGIYLHEKLRYMDHLAIEAQNNSELQNALTAAILSQCKLPDRKTIRKQSILNDLLNKIVLSENNYPLAIEGEPGTGKSTLLSLLFIHCMALQPEIQAFLVDTHYYDQEDKNMASNDLHRYLEQVDGCICGGRETILFIDGINRFSRGDQSLENIIVRWVEQWRTKQNVKFVLSIGVMDESLFPPFRHIHRSQPLPSKNTYKIILHPVQNNCAVQSKLVNLTVDYFKKANGSGLISTQSQMDKLCLYCKKAGGTSTDFRTVNFILKLMKAAPSIDEFFKMDIGVAFNRYFHSINGEASMMATAKYTARSLLQKKLIQKPAKFYYLFKSEAIRNFFFAYYYISLLKSKDVQNLKIFDCIFTPGINRFAVDLMLNEADHGRTIINNIQQLIAREDVTSHQKNQMAFMLGRVTSKTCKELSIEILSREYKQWDWNRRMTNSMAMYIRTVGISLIYLGCTIYASDFYEKLIYNGFLSRINRNFHIQYFISKGYRFDSALKLDDAEMCSAENIDGLYQYLYHSIFDKNSRSESMCINIITILNLSLYKIFYLGKDSDAEVQKVNKLINKLLSTKVGLSNNVVLEYIHNVKECISNGNIYISTLSKIYHLKMVPRSGWIKRGVDRHIAVESVADHTWACCQLALLFLPDNIEDCQFAEASEISVMGHEYNLSRILQMLIVHDLGEAYVGDILSSKKSEDDENRESSAFRSLVTLDTLPHFNTFGYIDDLAKEFKICDTYNAKLAKDIDLIEPLIQLFIYRDYLDSYAQDCGRREWDDWVQTVEARVNTAFGKNLLHFLSNQVLSFF